MNIVFVGGSRQVSRLSAQALERLGNITSSGSHVIVGDANGADKAVQKFLLNQSYDNVTVYCSGDSCRNNLGRWRARNIQTPANAKGFDFYAAKDREMAREADFGLMIWDGKSLGTLLNVLRLIRAGKKAVLLNVPEAEATTFKTTNDWQLFIAHLSSHFQNDLRKRATVDEWIVPENSEQPSLFEPKHHPIEASNDGAAADVAAEINAALATGDPMAVVNTLGNAAKTRGMSQIAKDTGLARESLYRSLSAEGNPEFATVFKVISSMGLRLMVGKAKSHDDRT
jgi:probable addiction module antidote protein